MRAVGYIACVVGGVVLGYLLLSLGVVDAVDGVPGTMQEPAIATPTYLGFMSAMMTAVTAVLAAVAIGIGVIAAYTVQEIRERADKRVEDALEKALSDEALNEALNDAVASYTRRKQGPTVAELEEGFDQEDTGNR